MDIKGSTTKELPPKELTHLYREKDGELIIPGYIQRCYFVSDPKRCELLLVKKNAEIFSRISCGNLYDSIICKSQEKNQLSKIPIVVLKQNLLLCYYLGFEKIGNSLKYIFLLFNGHSVCMEETYSIKNTTYGLDYNVVNNNQIEKKDVDFWIYFKHEFYELERKFLEKNTVPFSEIYSLVFEHRKDIFSKETEDSVNYLLQKKYLPEKDPVDIECFLVEDMINLEFPKNYFFLFYAEEENIALVDFPTLVEYAPDFKKNATGMETEKKYAFSPSSCTVITMENIYKQTLLFRKEKRLSISFHCLIDYIHWWNQWKLFFLVKPLFVFCLYHSKYFLKIQASQKTTTTSGYCASFKIDYQFDDYLKQELEYYFASVQGQKQYKNDYLELQQLIRKCFIINSSS